MITIWNCIQPILALLLSLGVTAGSMYVTVAAAYANTRGLIQELEIIPDAEEPSADSSEVGTAQTTDAAALRAVTVELDSDGNLVGRISSIDSASGDLQPTEEVEVTLVSGYGRELTAFSESDGTFTFRGLGPGAYTINAEGLEGRLSFGMRVVRNYDAATDEAIIPVPVAIELQLDAALAPSRDLRMLNQLLRGISVDPVKPQGEFNESVASTDADEDSEINGSPDSPGQQLLLDEDGSFTGQLTLLDPGTGNIVSVRDLDVRFLESDRVVASTSVKSDGSFTQENLQPGVYTMLIAGADGVAYMGVEVVKNSKSEFQPTGVRRPQQLAIGMLQGAGAAATNADSEDDDTDADADDADDTDSESEAAPETPPPGGATGGGGAPGSAAASGIENFLLPLVIGGAAGYFLADDDNSVASPSR